MDSDNQQQEQLESYGLLRFRSAPSLLPLSEEIHTSRFMNYSGEESPVTLKESSVGSPRGYAALPPHYPRSSSGMGSSYAMDGSYYRTPNSMAAEHPPKSAISNLTRQSSSPPDLFFSQPPSHNGSNTIRGAGNSNYRGVSRFSEEIISPTSNRLKGHNSFSSRQPSSLGIISDLGTDSSPRFPFNSWSDSTHFSENFAALKREEQNHDIKMLNTSMNGGIGNRPPMTSHRAMNLSRTSSDMSAMEKFLHLQDSVPCKIRAKRGCATHPRSIAERVRRTRISERMRKLQELVPNMDKQTNTSDMLDLAVDYIKDLQNEFKVTKDDSDLILLFIFPTFEEFFSGNNDFHQQTLSDRRANCKCLSMQNAVASHQHA